MTTKDKIINIIEEELSHSDFITDVITTKDKEGIADRIIAEVKPKPDLKIEKIISSAVKFPKTNAVKGPETEVIICGRRHADCYKSVEGILGYELDLDDYEERKRQGFMTSKGRYVTRKEAFKIAMANNQIFHKMYDGCDDVEERELTSEDLFGMND